MPDDPSLHGHSILVIADGVVMLEPLGDAGALVLGPIGKEVEALSFIDGEGNRFDTVLLDVNVHRRAACPIADQLVKRGMPSVFTTGDAAGFANASSAARLREGLSSGGITFPAEVGSRLMKRYDATQSVTISETATVQ